MPDHALCDRLVERKDKTIEDLLGRALFQFNRATGLEVENANLRKCAETKTLALAEERERSRHLREKVKSWRIVSIALGVMLVIAAVKSI